MGSPARLLFGRKRQTGLDCFASVFFLGGKGASVCELGATWREQELLSRQPRSLPPSLPWWRSLRSWRPAKTNPRRGQHGGSLRDHARPQRWQRVRRSPPEGPFWVEKRRKRGGPFQAAASRARGTPGHSVRRAGR